MFQAWGSRSTKRTRRKTSRPTGRASTLVTQISKSRCSKKFIWKSVQLVLALVMGGWAPWTRASTPPISSSMDSLTRPSINSWMKLVSWLFLFDVVFNLYGSMLLNFAFVPQMERSWAPLHNRSGLRLGKVSPVFLSVLVIFLIWISFPFSPVFIYFQAAINN